MAEGVIVRGDLIEFLNEYRCLSCQERKSDCIMKMNAERCLLCSDATAKERVCIFERNVQLRGSAMRFSLDILLAKMDKLHLFLDDERRLLKYVKVYNLSST